MGAVNSFIYFNFSGHPVSHAPFTNRAYRESKVPELQGFDSFILLSELPIKYFALIIEVQPEDAGRAFFRCTMTCASEFASAFYGAI